MSKGEFWEKGYTLIEVVVSLAILAIVLVPLGTMFTRTAYVNRDSQDVLAANQLAQKYMEYVTKGFDINSSGLSFETGQTFDLTKDTDLSKLALNASEKPPSDVDGVVTIEKYENYKSGLISGDTPPPTPTSIPTSQGSITLSKNNSIKYSVDSVDSSVESLSGNHIVELKAEKGEGNTIKLNFSPYSGTDGAFSRNYNYDAGKKEINISVYCDGTSDITFNVRNKTSFALKVYIVKTKSATNDVKVCNNEGSVEVFENLYDETVRNVYTNRVFKVTVEIKKGSRSLAKIAGLKTVE